MYSNPTRKTRLTLPTRRIAPGCIAGLFLALALLWLVPSPARADGPVGFTEAWFFDGIQDHTWSVAWGDMDGDGDLDLAVGNSGFEAKGQINRIYRNEGPSAGSGWGFSEINGALGSAAEATRSVAWGDMDGDGDLDLAVGNHGQVNRVYRNEGGGAFQEIPNALGSYAQDTFSIAWGDMDGDGDLDLAVGNNGVNRIHRNEGGGAFQEIPNALGSYADVTYSIAWGDMDSDGDLDLAVGNDGVNRVYRNDGGGGLQMIPVDLAGEDTHSIAWGDVDGDGDLDLAVGNYWQENRVYRNEGGGAFQMIPDALGSATDDTRSMAWGDMDGDGDLDLAVGNRGGVNRIYQNEGWGTFQEIPNALGPTTDHTYSVAWGDMDGDGDLDLVVGSSSNFDYPNYGQVNRVYRNESGWTFQEIAGALGSTADHTRSVAWGDMDGDGDLDLAVGNHGQVNRVYRNEGGGAFQEIPNALGADAQKTFSIAWGDMDGDGDLDLAVGNQNQVNRVYRNEGGGTFQELAGALGPATDDTRSIAWGDMDGDGDLDLAVGNCGPNGEWQINRIYWNEGAGTFQELAGALGSVADPTNDLAWGDMDGDGDLDLAVGSSTENYFQRNDGGGTFQVIPDDPSSVTSSTDSVAWGDMDGDGDLDLAIGRYRQINRVYRNEGGGAFQEIVGALGSATEDTYSVAWGDMDGDGDLDLAVGNCYQPTRIYRNEGMDAFQEIVNALNFGDHCAGSVAWGDMDGDGDLDLAIGDWGVLGLVNRVYRNPRQGLATVLPDNAPYIAVSQPYTLPAANFYAVSAILDSPTIPITYTLFDPEGDLVGGVQVSYSPDGGGRWLPAVATTGTVTTHLATGQPATHTYTWDTFASGFFGQSDNVVLRFVAYPQASVAAASGAYSYTNRAPGPFQQANASATTFPFRVQGTQVRVFSETVSVGNAIANALVYRIPAGQSGDGFPLANSGGSLLHTDQRGYLQGRGTIAQGDTLVALAPVHSALRYAGAAYLDGQGDYLLSQPFTVPVSDITLSLWLRSGDTSGDATILSYLSPLSKTQFFITNYNDLTIQRGTMSVTTGISLTNGLWQHLAMSWRGSDGQLRVYKNGLEIYSNTLAPGTLISPGGSLALGWDQQGPATFNGLLDEVRLWERVRSQAEIQADIFNSLHGDEPELAAYWPFNDNSQTIAFDQTANGNDAHLQGAVWMGQSLGGYAVYHTNALPTANGLSGHLVNEPGVQHITVTKDHPLLIFDLSVSLEWDARQDASFLEQLKSDLRRASAILYDATNGQAVLGGITIYHDRKNWFQSDVRIHASNALRPHATIGGLQADFSSELITATQAATSSGAYTLTYGPGRVNMGSVWNRFGEASGTLGEDWPRTLAHELGHYVFYLRDNYIGLNDAGIVVPPDKECPGSLMTNPYLDDFSEFHPQHAWVEDCASTLSHQTTARSDWETIAKFYPWLDPEQDNPGPSALPLLLTQFREASYLDEPTTLDVPIFYLKQNSASVQPGGSAQGILYRGQRLVDLGRPSLDKLRAWGATPGDELCLYEPGADPPRLGCEVISQGDVQLALGDKPGWQPDVVITPVNSRTLVISVTVSGLTSEALQGRLYPHNQAATAPITLSAAAQPNVYAGQFSLRVPAGLGYVRIWIAETVSLDDTRREAVANYALNGNPGTIGNGIPFDQSGFTFSNDGLTFSNDGLTFSNDGLTFSNDGLTFSNDGLTFSNDGLTFSNDGLTFSNDGLTFSNDGLTFSNDGLTFSNDGLTFSNDGLTFSNDGLTLAQDGFAPAFSIDGQAVLYGAVAAEVGQFYTLQRTSNLPDVPPWLTVVGAGYRLSVSPNNSPSFEGTSFSMRYQGKDVPPGEEPFLSLYHWDGTEWSQLPTARNSEYNEASAAAVGEGLYALMSRLEIPLYKAGWNMFAYPVQGQRPVAEALQSIEGHFATVYGYDITDDSDPWKVYGADAPDWVNDLQAFEFGQGYWINVTEPITLQLKGAYSLAALSGASNVPVPPATYYGPLPSVPGLTPAAGLTVNAWIDSGQGANLCGQAQTQEIDGRIVFAIDVLAQDFGDDAGCGAPGRMVTFEVGSRTLYWAIWDNDRVHALDTYASFTANPRSGAAPLTVQFDDTSGALAFPWDWEWTFGDGGTSTLENPLHTFTTAGSYTVSLTIRVEPGTATLITKTTDTLTRANYITVWNEQYVYLPLIIKQQ